MSTNFVTKRPHKKSRGGCQTCKTKKVKCDENQPKCTFCEKRGLNCIYSSKPVRLESTLPSPLSSTVISRSQTPELSHASSSSSSPSSSSSSDDDFTEDTMSWELITSPNLSFLPATSGGLSQTDLRMMHHWSTVTWNSIIPNDEGSGLMLMYVPQLAFDNKFLLDCIFGISSLHMEYLSPTSELNLKITTMYRVKALNGFREALARIDPHSPGWEAALSMAILLVVLFSKDPNNTRDQLSVVNMIVLYRGLGTIIMMRSFTDVKATKVFPIFRRELNKLESVPVVPTILLKLLEEITPDDPDFEHLEGYCKALDALGVLYASLRQDGLKREFYIRIVAWASYLNDSFAECAKAKRPRTMVIITHYLVFLKLLRGIWWLEGTSDTEIDIVQRMVGSKWWPYMEVPLQARMMTNNEDIVKLLLS